MQTGLPIARIEFLDSKTIRGSNKYSKTNLDEKPTLFLEFHGSDKNVEQQADIISNNLNKILIINGKNSILLFKWKFANKIIA